MKECRAPMPPHRHMALGGWRIEIDRPSTRPHACVSRTHCLHSCLAYLPFASLENWHFIPSLSLFFLVSQRKAWTPSSSHSTVRSATKGRGRKGVRKKARARVHLDGGVRVLALLPPGAFLSVTALDRKGEQRFRRERENGGMDGTTRCAVSGCVCFGLCMRYTSSLADGNCDLPYPPPLPPPPTTTTTTASPPSCLTLFPSSPCHVGVFTPSLDCNLHLAPLLFPFSS